MYTIPHGIEIGPDGNVWTTDAHTSKIYEFTPMGKQLLEIEVGGIPEACALGRPGHSDRTWVERSRRSDRWTSQPTWSGPRHW